MFTMHFRHATLLFVHTRAWQGSSGFFLPSFQSNPTVRSKADGWHMWPQLPACPTTQEFALRFHPALPPTAALLTRAPRFNYWPGSALKPHQLNHTGNCLSQCKGGNWTAGLGGEQCTHVVPVRIWLCGEFLADCIMASWTQIQAPLGAISKIFLRSPRPLPHHREFLIRGLSGTGMRWTFLVVVLLYGCEQSHIQNKFL